MSRLTKALLTREQKDQIVLHQDTSLQTITIGQFVDWVSLERVGFGIGGKVLVVDLVSRVLVALLVVVVASFLFAVAKRRKSRRSPSVIRICHYDSHCYYLFPSYISTGGLRQFIFFSDKEHRYRYIPDDDDSMKQNIDFARKRSGSFSSDDSRPNDAGEEKPLEPAVLVYHESARDIVFRDQLRRTAVSRASSTVSNDSVESGANVLIANYQPAITPLPGLELGQMDEFKELKDSYSTSQDEWTDAEREVVQMIKEERALVKTVKNTDWTSFLHRFRTPQEMQRGYHGSHADGPPKNGIFRFNSFVTSTSLL